MPETVTIFGGAGFVGRYIARRLIDAGHSVRVAGRRSNVASVTPGTDMVKGDIRDEASVAAAIDGATAVVNCVGTFDWRGDNDFEAVQNRGAGRVARVAAAQGISRFVHLSAIGADPKAASAYGRSKAAGEAAVQEAQPDAVILRPSVIFGPEDQFFNRFAAMTKLSPVLPLFGAETRFQPVYVDDVAAAAAKAITGEVALGIYELGGPEVASFRALMKKMLSVLGRTRPIVGFPDFAGEITASLSDLGAQLTGGLITGPISRDQLKSLGTDNVVSSDAQDFATLGLTPTPMEDVLPGYLT